MLSWLEKTIEYLAWLQFWYFHCQIEERRAEWFFVVKQRVAIWLYDGLKWLLHLVSGCSYIERLCTRGEQSVSDRQLHDVLFCLLIQFRMSKQVGHIVRELEGNVYDSIKSIESVKRISPGHSELLGNSLELHYCLQGIVIRIKHDASRNTEWSNTQARQKCIELYHSVFDNEIDEKDLSDVDTELTSLLSGDYEKSVLAIPKPNPKSKGELDWVSLGFQGLDPCTDFRGTGVFGLLCLHYFCTTRPQTARCLAIQSGSRNGDLSKPWYSLALMSIHISHFLLSLLDQPLLLRWTVQAFAKEDLNSEKSEKSVTTLEPLLYTKILDYHSILVIAFHNQWIREVDQGMVTSVMHFEDCLTRFKYTVLTILWRGEEIERNGQVN